VKIVVFLFFIHSGDILCCRFHLGSRSCPSGERGARDKGQHHGCSQHCSNHCFWQLDTRVLIAAGGAAAYPLPCWLCTVFVAVDGINRQKKKKDYNGMFVQVHNCRIFIDLILTRKVEGWVLVERLT